MSTSPNVVNVRIVTDRLSTVMLLETRMYIVPNFDCQVLIQAGSSKGTIDNEVEADLQAGAEFRTSVYLANNQKMIIRVKSPYPESGLIPDLVSFTANASASRLKQNPPGTYPGEIFDVSIKTAKQHREYQGKKRSRWLLV